MKYRTLKLSCPCGKITKHVAEVGLTCEHQIVFHWRCSRCRNEMYLVRALSDCWRDCPSSGQGELSTAVDFTDTIGDRRFLHMLGVRDPDETV